METIVCSNCGHEELTEASSMGVVNDKSFYGNHTCVKGMGTFFIKDSGIQPVNPDKVKEQKEYIYNKIN